MSIFHHLRLAISSLSFRKKLLLSYLCLVLIPLMVLSIFFYSRTSSSLQEHSRRLCDLHLTQVSGELDSTITEMISVARSLSRQEYLRTSLEQDADSVSMEQQIDVLDNLLAEVDSIYIDSSVFSVRLFVNSDYLYAKRRVVTWPLADIDLLFPSKEDYIMQFTMLHGATVLSDSFPAKRSVFSLTMPMYGDNDYSRTIALICVDVSQEAITDIISKADYSEEGEVYLVDASGVPFFGYSNRTHSIISEDQFPESFNVGKKQIIENGNTLTAVSQPIGVTWYLVACSPSSALLGIDAQLPFQLLVVSMIIGVIVFFLARLSAHSNSRRIIALSGLARAVQSGNLNVRCTVDSYDEIGDLQISFNEMIQQMQHMLETQYQMGKKLKEGELRLLQAQINPHFLYNTLNLINWTAQKKSRDEVCDIVTMLSRYYQISLSKGLEQISIREELEHISLYVQICNKRFDGKIALVIHAPQEVYDYCILKLLLQPIVENSITHGLLNKEGTVTIDISESEEHLLISVTDDGSGISPQKLKMLRLSQELKMAPGTNGYGLVNIMERLRNYYGENASIDFISTPGQGSIVKIMIPIEKTTKIRVNSHDLSDEAFERGIPTVEK